MTCEQAREQLIRLLDGERPGPVVDHVAGCAVCSAEELALRRLRDDLDLAGSEVAPAPPAVLARIRATAASEGLLDSEPVRAARVHGVGWGARAAAALLLIAVGFLLGRGQPGASPGPAPILVPAARIAAEPAPPRTPQQAPRIWRLDDRFAARGPTRPPVPRPVPRPGRSIWSLR